jgi:hypothetical protein
VKLDPAACFTPSMFTPKKDLMLGHYPYIDISLKVDKKAKKYPGEILYQSENSSENFLRSQYTIVHPQDRR